MADSIVQLTNEANPEDRTIEIANTNVWLERTTLKNIKAEIDLLNRQIDSLQAQRAILREKRREIIRTLNFNIEE